MFEMTHCVCLCDFCLNGWIFYVVFMCNDEFCWCCVIDFVYVIVVWLIRACEFNCVCVWIFLIFFVF